MKPKRKTLKPKKITLQPDDRRLRPEELLALRDALRNMAIAAFRAGWALGSKSAARINASKQVFPPGGIAYIPDPGPEPIVKR